LNNQYQISKCIHLLPFGAVGTYRGKIHLKNDDNLRKETNRMPMKRDYTMLKVDSFKFNVALANAELEPKTLSKKSGVAVNIVYAARKGCYVKPMYLGKLCKAMSVEVTDVIEQE